MAQIKKLKLNGKTIYPVTHPKAVIDPSSGRSITATVTQSANGLMSAVDKKKLDAFGEETSYVKTSGNQTIAGQKTFNSQVIGSGFRSNHSTSDSSGHFQFNCNYFDNAIRGQIALYENTNSSSARTEPAILFTINNKNGGQVQFWMYYDGTFTCRTVNQTSDIRLKKDINVIESDDVLQNVSKIQAKSFLYKDNIDNGKVHYGYIAQDVEKVIPDLVFQQKATKDTPNPMKNLNYTELLVLKVTYLEKKITDFETRILKLESLVAKLTQPETEV